MPSSSSAVRPLSDSKRSRGGTSSATTTRNHDTVDVRCSTVTFEFRGNGGSVVLLDGSASIFSAPLTRNVRYHFSKCGVPVVVPTEARIDVEGEYKYHRDVLDSTVSDLHAVLETVRARAVIAVEARKQQSLANAPAAASEDEEYTGPRVIVVGDQNTGKSSLCRSLVNLAVSKNSAHRYGITFVDTDVGQQCITIPGTVAAAFMEAPVAVDEGFNTVMPLSFFYGDKLVNAVTRKRYLDLCACCAQAAASLGFAKPQFECGGMIINTMGWTVELGRDLLLEMLSIFSVTHVIVTGSDPELETVVRQAAIGRSLEVLRYPKQEAILKRGGSLLADARTQQLVAYFAGTPRTPLSPARGVAKVAEVTFLNALTLSTMTWQDIRPCSVAAVVWADTEETAAEANVAGFVILLEVGKRFFTFLAPATGDLPKPFLLVSSTLSLPPAHVPAINS